MPRLFGQNLTRTELLRRVGDFRQVTGMRQYVYSSGWSKGISAVEVNTGAFRFEVLPDRCLDIASMSRMGVPAGYYSKSGLRHPAYYNAATGAGFRDAFFGGVLTTCGFHNTGPAREHGGAMQPAHGLLANMPAERINLEERWDGDDCFFTISGEVRHSSFYGGDLVLRRRISSRTGASWLRIEDEVENRDFAPALCLLLYHCQFGFPFLDAASRLLTSGIEKSVGRHGGAVLSTEEFASFAPPRDGQDEVCFYHTCKPGPEGWAAACLFNGNLGMGAYVRFSLDTLPLLVEWKMLRSREYVCGLEPATAILDDRSAADIARCTLAPMEKRRFRVELGIVAGKDELRELSV